MSSGKEAIRISPENKAELDKIKIHKRQSYDEVISILLEAYERVRNQFNVKPAPGVRADG